MASGGAGHDAAAGSEMIRFLAYTTGATMMVVGILVSTQQFLNTPFLDTIIVPVPSARNQVGLFGLLFFGTGLALMLTQVFAERYGAKIAGIAFVGTLAALYLFMLIARSTVFDFEVDVSEFYPRDLELSVKCDQQSFHVGLEQARKPIVTIAGVPERVSSIRSAIKAYQETHLVPNDQPAILLSDADRLNRFRHVGNPDRDIILEPVVDEGNLVVFMIPHVVFAARDRITFHMADDDKSTTTGSNQPTQKPSSTKVLTLTVDGKSDATQEKGRPLIQAELNLQAVADVCSST